MSPFAEQPCRSALPAIAIACALLGSLWAVHAAAQGPAAKTDAAYPARPIRLIVAFPPGGGADLTARTVGQKMAESLGQPVIVENKPGANGIVGADAVAKSPPDGYTMLLIDRGALGINPSLYKALPFDPAKDFDYVGIVTTAPYVVAIDGKLPARTLAEFVQLAKAKPGSMNYGSFGVGSMAHLNIEALKVRLGIDLVHIPYKGVGPAVQAVAAGESALTIGAPPAILGFTRDGRMRALAIGSPRRSPLMPDVPTLAQAGGGEDTLVPTYFAFALPAGTPRPIVERLNAEMKRAVTAPDVADRLTKAGLDPTGGSPEALTDLVKRDIPRFRQLARDIGIQPE
jgi:tripartite-type tricarboxylate transporter receptor subunit TctC